MEVCKERDLNFSIIFNFCFFKFVVKILESKSILIETKKTVEIETKNTKNNMIRNLKLRNGLEL